MQHLSIARSLRLTLIALTLALAVLAAVGVAGLYRARQRYENTLASSSALATAGANLLAAGAVEEEALRAPRSAAGDVARREAAADRRLAATGRAPEEHRADVVAFDLQAQRLAGSEKIFLSDELVERARSHPISQRARSGAFFLRLDGLKKSHAQPR